MATDDEIGDTSLHLSAGYRERRVRLTNREVYEWCATLGETRLWRVEAGIFERWKNWEEGTCRPSGHLLFLRGGHFFKRGLQFTCLVNHGLQLHDHHTATCPLPLKVHQHLLGPKASHPCWAE